jgi:hypothetical protein
MLSTRELLQQGLVWRVGDGRSIKIWGDRWLPTPTMYTVQLTLRMLPQNSTISCLVDPASKGWNLGLINDLFFEEEAKAISNIPLSPTLLQDRLVW